MHASRRSTLQRLSALALMLAAGRLRSSEAAAPRLPHWRPRFEHDPFTLGIASGQPRPDSVVLWTRLAPQPHAPGGGLPPLPIRLRWEVADDDRFARVVRRGEVIAKPELGHSVRVRVQGLAPGRIYHYRFLLDAVASPVGRTRTAPAPDARPDRLTIALASCQHYEQGRYVAHREIAASDVDLVLFVGDYIYDSSNPAFLLRPHEGPPPQTLDEYRARHATYKLDADLQAAHAAHPWLLCWDDHEVRNDYAGERGSDPDEAGRFLAIRQAAYQAYFEHLPLALDQLPGAAGMRMHDHWTWGQLAELWTLDGRQHRSEQVGVDPDAVGGRLISEQQVARADPRRTLLGVAQERWLHDGLAASQRRWKLIGQGTQMSPSGIELMGRRLVSSDGWDGYPAARERLLGHIAERRLEDVVMLGGDVHRHVAANLRLRPNDPRSPPVASEFVTTSITSRGLATPLNDLIRESNTDILHARSDSRGYARIEVGNRWLHFVARETAFPARDQATLKTQVRFTIETGRAGPQKDSSEEPTSPA
ncbi:alkaline phosphatase D family protein [Leptothrix discophora]|uniref:Alkaline phosphatase D family protein n=1 Tax=Leptothrix discophora TaxID=89 RepID=A0ABT9G8W0_LEPDI|nr:alkaline phosphatase D family protein [Leptothrix discophora]MDP4302861.1 alkaline phosphatase D family protein [Leptothrix discophora]